MDDDLVKIREVSKDDYDSGHLQLYKQLTLIDPEKISRIDYENMINELNENHKIFVITNAQKEIIASGTIFIEKKLIRNICKLGHIEDIVVDNRYRGKGYGKLLINHLIDYCKRMNCYKINLNCNESTIAFYKSNGFENIGCQMAIYLRSKL